MSPKTPFTLVPLPSIPTTPNSHPAHFIARDMAQAHNNMLRALTSIYLQAPQVTSPADIHSLLLYTSFFISWLSEHHHGEETFLFPALESVTGVKGLMSKNVKQHEAFEPGLKRLEAFVKRELEVWKEGGEGEWDGMVMRGVIDGFGEALSVHLGEEIGTLLGLEQFDGPAVLKVYNKFDGEMRKGEKDILFPMVMTSSDLAATGEEWPVVPGPVRYLIHYWFERKYAAAWRFAPSDTWGRRRPLAFPGERE